VQQRQYQLQQQQQELHQKYLQQKEVIKQQNQSSEVSKSEKKGKEESLFLDNNNNNNNNAKELEDSGIKRFELLEQPKQRQRKAYKEENRYITPNPLKIVPLKGPIEPPITEGMVYVSLEDKDGDELPPNKKTILESHDGLFHKLDSNFESKFSLKVMETSDGSPFRLLFEIIYSSGGVQLQQNILSSPFYVLSNTRKKLQEPASPLVEALKPERGWSTKDTEVWIKGKGFSNAVAVYFGERPGKVIEITECLLTVLAPSRAELLQDTPVLVTVANKNKKNFLEADHSLKFTYRVRKLNNSMDMESSMQ